MKIIHLFCVHVCVHIYVHGIYVKGVPAHVHTYEKKPVSFFDCSAHCSVQTGYFTELAAYRFAKLD